MPRFALILILPTLFGCVGCGQKHTIISNVETVEKKVDNDAQKLKVVSADGIFADEQGKKYYWRSWLLTFVKDANPLMTSEDVRKLFGDPSSTKVRDGDPTEFSWVYPGLSIDQNSNKNRQFFADFLLQERRCPDRFFALNHLPPLRMFLDTQASRSQSFTTSFAAQSGVRGLP